MNDATAIIDTVGVLHLTGAAKTAFGEVAFFSTEEEHLICPKKGAEVLCDLFVKDEGAEVTACNLHIAQDTHELGVLRKREDVFRVFPLPTSDPRSTQIPSTGLPVDEASGIDDGTLCHVRLETCNGRAAAMYCVPRLCPGVVEGKRKATVYTPSIATVSLSRSDLSTGTEITCRVVYAWEEGKFSRMP